MKTKLPILTIFLSLSLPLFAFGEEQTITLKDGSVIKGEVSSMLNGVYTLRTTSMGATQINGDQVASISNGSVPAAALGISNQGSLNNPAAKLQMNDIQQNIMSNPAMMADIQNIASDPEIIKLLSNPAMLQAVTTKDMDAIKNNPATAELMNNPKMQSLIEKLQSSGSKSSN